MENNNYEAQNENVQYAEGEVVGEATENGTNVMSIISLVVGILSILSLCISYCVSFFSIITLILGIVGLVLGIIAIKKSTVNKGLAIAGIITSAAGIVLAIPAIGCMACTTLSCLGTTATGMSSY